VVNAYAARDETPPARLTPVGEWAWTTAPLPAPMTPLVGREREIAAVGALLGRDGVRLVTLTGPGGVGKTRLAVRVATEVEGTFADGVCFVSLAAIHDPALVLPTIGQALDLRDAGGRSLEERLRRLLRDRELLLVLDNFEQVVEAASALNDLLEACPALKALVTSRTLLRLTGEHEFAVPPLRVADPGRLPSLADLAKYEAIALFVERTRAMRPDFALTEANAATVADVCARLDGLPLAIELAAARGNVLSPQALLARLSHRLDVLTGGARDAPDRLRTMRGAVAWSHDLLTADEQALFRRLSDFVGGFDVEAAEYVVGQTDRRTDGQTDRGRTTRCFCPTARLSVCPSPSWRGSNRSSTRVCCGSGRGPTASCGSICSKRFAISGWNGWRRAARRRRSGARTRRGH
jgi:NB-ARC domain